MNLPRDFRDALQAAVMSRRGERRGREIRFLCPQHEAAGEHTPSADYNADKAAWTCRTCGVGGGALDLAKRLNVPLPGRDGTALTRTRRPVEQKRERHAYQTLADALRPAERASKCKVVETWTYRDANDAEALVVARLEAVGLPKTFRPVHRTGAGWLLGDPPGALPLYGLPELLVATAGGRLYVVEGERKADALRRLGLVATCSAHGARSAAKSDWTPAGRFAEVVLMPDRDTPGESYVADVASLLRAFPGKPAS